MLIGTRKIEVTIRPNPKPGPVKAYADLLLIFSDGELQIIGFAIIEHPGKAVLVAFPQNSGRDRYFPSAAAKGALRKEIIDKILRAYKEAKERK